jgi:protein phosphatase
MLKIYAITDVGKVRQNNEDNYLVNELTSHRRPELDEVYATEPGQVTVLMVSDGMGGAAAGEVASLLGVEAVKNYFVERAGTVFTYHDIDEALQLANLSVLQHAFENPEKLGMGATATLAIIQDSELLIGQVGDSRAYLLRNQELEQITVDQTYVNQLVESGKITPEEAEIHPRKNLILQALGSKDFLDVVISRRTLQDGDKLLLCSDGLSGMLSAEEIAVVVESRESLKESCKLLVDYANAKGGIDNITVILAEYYHNGTP